MSSTTSRLIRSATAAAALASLCATATALPSSGVEPVPEQQHISWDPTGAVFRCGGTDLTVEPGGLVSESFHLWVDRQGNLRFQDAITFHDVTAADSSGQRFAVSGAMTIADRLISWEQPLVATDTTHIVIRGATGGVLGKVQVVIHVTADARQHVLDIGTCVAP